MLVRAEEMKRKIWGEFPSIDGANNVRIWFRNVDIVKLADYVRDKLRIGIGKFRCTS